MATGRYSTSISLSFFDLQNIFSKVCHIVDHHHHHLFRAYTVYDDQGEETMKESGNPKRVPNNMEYRQHIFF